MVIQCCVCSKVRQQGGWVPAEITTEAATAQDVSHGYCPPCAEAAFAEIRRVHKQPRSGHRLAVNL